MDIYALWRQITAFLRLLTSILLGTSLVVLYYSLKESIFAIVNHEKEPGHDNYPLAVAHPGTRVGRELLLQSDVQVFPH